jgi:hypothetical protein
VAAPFLTVLATPIAGAARRLYQGMRSALRPLVKPGVPLPFSSPYPGHYAVTRSVVEGLRANGADFNFNPRAFRQLAHVVYAPANEALRQAALLKREGRIDFLAAGPTNALFPSECDSILLMPEIDLLIVASDWVADLLREEAPALALKTRVSPSGVDAAYWSPSPRRTRAEAVVYWKSGDEAFCGEIERHLARHGLVPRRVRYGSYTAEQFKTALDTAALAVFVSQFETQGLALAEAWSMDVPTVVWDPRGPVEWRGRTFRKGSSAPYLTPETGVAWRTLDELGAAIADVRSSRAGLRPRQWVLEHMTDAIRARAFFRVMTEATEAAVGS